MTDASKILMIFPTPAPSHYIIGKQLMHVLADRGHEVTIIAPYHDENLPKNCKEIFLDTAFEIKREYLPNSLI